ncbi:hypothetical protein LTS18_006634, partial [Coniosporium uncinatum]
MDLTTITEDVAADAPADQKSLAEIATKANLEYGLKRYNEAADLYSTAVEKQAEQNGEMASENAELLYLYGKCLFKVAVANSDVLGGKVAGEKKPEKPAKKAAANGEGSSKTVLEAAKQEENDAVSTGVEAKVDDAPASSNNPFFSVTGMENWESDEEEDGDGEAAEEEQEDDFANAYEILDMARTLFERRLQQEE